MCFAIYPPSHQWVGRGVFRGAFRGRVPMVLRRKGFPPAGCAAMIARAQVQSRERNRNIKARLPFAVSLLAECQRRRMKTGFLLHEYDKQSKRLFGCWHNRGSFSGGRRRNFTPHGAHWQSVGSCCSLTIGEWHGLPRRGHTRDPMWRSAHGSHLP